MSVLSRHCFEELFYSAILRNFVTRLHRSQFILKPSPQDLLLCTISLATCLFDPVKTLFYEGLTLCHTKFEYFIPGRVRSSVYIRPSGPALRSKFSTFLRGRMDPKKKFIPKKLKIWFSSNVKKNLKNQKKNLGSFFLNFGF